MAVGKIPRNPRVKYLGFVALGLVVLFGVLADRSNEQAAENALRASVHKQIRLIRAQLEGNINGNIHLVQGLVGTIKTEPEMDQQRFSELASHLFTGENQLRSVAAAPNMVISLVYPMAGNEAAIGLDYRNRPDQREAALRARDEGRPLVAGPVELVQGGKGLVARFPVFTGTAEETAFWGLVAAVIDVEQLYRDSGLLDIDLPIDIALIGKDSMGASGEQFFGLPGLLDSDPEVVDVWLPGGSWVLAATPRSGWGRSTGALWLQRSAIVVAGLLVMLPIVIAGRLSEQRQKSMGDLRLREDKLRRLSRRLELALEASRVGVWELNIETEELVWDDRMCELYGLPPENRHPVVDDWRNALHPDDRARADREFAESLASHNRYNSEFRVLLPDGRVRHIRAKAAVYRDVGDAPRIIGLNWDVTADVLLRDALEQAKADLERRNAELEATKGQIEHMALHDSLTDLPNRRFLDLELARCAREANKDGASISLLIVDLDRFKQINDTFGHAAGDALLTHVANILRSLAQPTDFIARIGGDEFVMICRHSKQRQHLLLLAQSIVAKMRQPLVYEGNVCRFGVSVGIATASDSAGAVSQLLINADMALYEAKSTGRNRFAFYTQSLQTRTVRTKRLADDILRGIEDGEFIPFYQPRYDAKSFAICGVEALARWQHPKQGILTPNRFLDVAEEFNVTAAIDREIMKQTLLDMTSWNRQGILVPHASVNVSAQRLVDPELLEGLEDLDIEPGTLSFELVESIFLDDSDRVDMESIERIKALGIDIEIDDFGSGRASIISLLNINPKRLKIDRQLIIPMLDSQPSRQLVRLAIEIGQSLDIEVIAEGVETVGHAQLLKKLGCDMLQGHLLGRPMAADALVRHLSKPIDLSA